MKHRLLLFLAQGFGVGRIPVAPGTFGSVVGLLWYGLLLWSGNVWVLLAGTMLAIAMAIRVCGAAEKLLGQRDPGSVVLDEIVAIPVCFAAWTALYWQAHQALPEPRIFFWRNNWMIPALIFAGFRLFDILKPWPVRQSQELPGGWGVVVDDVLAAVYVNLMVVAGWGCSAIIAATANPI